MSTPTLSIPAGNDRVLLAIEDEASADLLAHRMTRRGLQPERVTNGREALQALRRTPFDLVVIEIHLPGLNGLELLRYTPSDDIVGDPQIVLLGQRGNNEHVIRAFELGAAEYIQRPFAPEVATARILRFLDDERRFVSRTPAQALLLAAPLSAGGPVGASTLPLWLMIKATAGLILLALLFALIAAVVHVHAKSQRSRHRARTTHWKELLLDVLAGDTAPQRLVDAVGASEERAFLAFLTPYAVTVTGHSKTLLTRLAVPFLTRLEDDLTSWRTGVRARAVQLFGLLGDASCRGLLRRRLDDPSTLVRYTAFRWLARRGDPDDTEPLLDQLDQLSHVAVNQLSSALVHLGEEAAPVLRHYLGNDDQSTFTRVVCAETLRWLGEGDTAPLAAQLLVYEPPPELTAALLRLLRRVGRPEHAPLVRSYCVDDHSFVRIHAARALGQIGHPNDDRKLLRRLVTDTDSRWVAFNAAKSLTELGQTTPLHHISRSAHERASLAKTVLKEPTR